MSKIFFTSDHHFGHNNIINLCNRPFNSVEEMNQIMIDRWNDRISPDDEVYYLGDFAIIKGKEEVAHIIDQLNGIKYLIKGNHDGSALSNPKKFKWIKDYHELKVKDSECENGIQRIILFHYAMRTWRGYSRGNWHLYGHSHGNLPDNKKQLAFDVGVDCHDYYPLSYEDVKTIMKTKNGFPLNI